MQKELNFIKLVGSGNDFILIDHGRGINFSRLAERICHRKFGVGADGLLVAATSKSARPNPLTKISRATPVDKWRMGTSPHWGSRMRIFNPDGSEADMCGNGARCFAYYLSTKLRPGNFSFETNAGILQAKVKNNLVKISMTEPRDLRLNLDIALAGKKFKGHCINTGVPHTVVFADNVEKIDVKGLGREIRKHDLFKPRGTNVNFAEVLNKDTLRVRTYERGVEDETLACGTGSTAAAIIAALTKKIKPGRGNSYCVKAVTQGNEVLKIYFTKNDSEISDVWLEGKVGLVYQGTYYRL